MQKILIYLVFGLLGFARTGHSEPVSESATEVADPQANINIIPQDELVAGGLTQPEILEVIRAGLTPIRNCYVRRLKVKKNLSGKMKTFWNIDVDGKVDSAEVTESTLKDARLSACVVKVIQGWKFPKPRGGVSVKVTYPFVFNPDL